MILSLSFYNCTFKPSFSVIIVIKQYVDLIIYLKVVVKEKICSKIINTLFPNSIINKHEAEMLIFSFGL